jgi:hypothetical protein
MLHLTLISREISVPVGKTAARLLHTSDKPWPKVSELPDQR